jgi:hypothetical protein
MKLLMGGQDIESQKIKQFDKLVKQPEVTATTVATVNPEQLPAVDTSAPAIDSFGFGPDNNGNTFGDFSTNQGFQNPEFPGLKTSLLPQ